MYTATKYSSVEEKVKFEKQFKKFVSGGFQPKDFPKWFYTQLSMCFGHIGHYNQGQFYEEWFAKEASRKRFVKRIKNMTIYGKPESTYSDVEQVLKNWLIERG